MSRTFALVEDGNEVARHSTRLACVIEAIERKLVVQTCRAVAFVEGVRIKELSNG